MWTTSTNDAAVSRSRGRRRLRSIRATSRARAVGRHRSRTLPPDGWMGLPTATTIPSQPREGGSASPPSLTPVQHPGRPLPPSLLHPPREATEERLLRLGLGWTGRAANEPEQGGQAGRGLAGQVIGGPVQSEGRRRWLLLVLNSPWQRVRCAGRRRRITWAVFKCRRKTNRPRRSHLRRSVLFGYASRSEKASYRV